jgi:hypothetical protein
MQVLQDAVRNGWSVLREYPKFNRLIVSTLPGAAPPTAAAGGASVGIASLQTLNNHVKGVERNGFISAPRPVPDYEATSPSFAAAAQAGSNQGRARASTARSDPAVCAQGDPSNPDAGMGLQSEGVPYGACARCTGRHSSSSGSNGHKCSFVMQQRMPAASPRLLGYGKAAAAEHPTGTS